MQTRQLVIPPSLLLPCSSLEHDIEVYNKILLVLLNILLLLSIVVPLINVPEIDREKAEALPPTLAKIILEKQALPPPPAATAARQVFMPAYWAFIRAT